MLFIVTTVVYFLDVWGRQVWLGVIYAACLLDNIHTVRKDRFTKWDRDRLTELESIFSVTLRKCNIASLKGRHSPKKCLNMSTLEAK